MRITPYRRIGHQALLSVCLAAFKLLAQGAKHTVDRRATLQKRPMRFNADRLSSQPELP